MSEFLTDQEYANYLNDPSVVSPDQVPECEPSGSRVVTFTDSTGDSYRALWHPNTRWRVVCDFFSNSEGTQWSTVGTFDLEDYKPYTFGRTEVNNANDYLAEIADEFTAEALADSIVAEDMATFEGGGVRSSSEGKPRFDLLLAPDMPYEDQFLYRFAMSMTEGATLYGEHNYALMSTEDAMKRGKESLLRHVMQYVAGETDEDHAARAASNLLMLSKIEHNIKRANDA